MPGFVSVNFLLVRTIVQDGLCQDVEFNQGQEQMTSEGTLTALKLRDKRQ